MRVVVVGRVVGVVVVVAAAAVPPAAVASPCEVWAGGGTRSVNNVKK